MNDERKKWSEQYTANIGVREFFRLGCAIIIWIFILIAFSVALELAGYSAALFFNTTFVTTIFMFLFTVHSWEPAYSLLRKILGNNNLPLEPIPRATTPRQPRSWWSYLPGL